MPDLQTPSSADSADPLSKLHKMSTTAGLGSGDYVAVNVTAVIAVLFGAGSVLGMLSNVLLVVPVVGIVLSVIALVQINRSNGTQTGKGIAIGGLLLSLGIGGWIIGAQVAEQLGRRSDREQVAALVLRLGETIKNQKPDDGYKLFGGQFPSRVSKERFSERMSVYHMDRAKELWGEFQSLEWNGHMQFQKDETTGQMVAGTVGLGRFTKSTDPHRYAMYFRKLQNGWVIESMPDLFPLDQPKGPGGAPPQ